MVMNNLKISGEWWLPKYPKRRRSGLLEYKNDSIILTIERTFEEEQIDIINRTFEKPEIIIGDSAGTSPLNPADYPGLVSPPPDVSGLIITIILSIVIGAVGVVAGLFFLKSRRLERELEDLRRKSSKKSPGKKPVNTTGSTSVTKNQAKLKESKEPKNSPSKNTTILTKSISKPKKDKKIRK